MMVRLAGWLRPLLLMLLLYTMIQPQPSAAQQPSRDDAHGDTGSAGLAAQLASAVGDSPNAPTPALRPEARYLFYDILEHEQLNKQRKGFMYALKIAQSLGRELVLHRLRVRKYDPAAQHKLSHWRTGQGRPPFTHVFFPWRKYFNISRLTAGLPPVHEFDVLMHALGAGGGGIQSGSSSGDFEFDHVLYMNSLLEGRRDMVGIHDRQVKYTDTPA